MPIPFIPLILGGAALVASALGVKKGVDAASDIKRAGRIAEEARRKAEGAVSRLEAKRLEVNKHADDYARLLLTVRENTFGRFVTFVESLGQRGSIEAIQALEEVRITPPQLREYKMAAIEAHNVAVGAVSMAASSAGARYRRYRARQSLGHGEHRDHDFRSERSGRNECDFGLAGRWVPRCRRRRDGFGDSGIGRYCISAGNSGRRLHVGQPRRESAYRGHEIRIQGEY